MMIIADYRFQIADCSGFSLPQSEIHNLQSEMASTPILQHSNTPCLLGYGIFGEPGEHASANQERAYIGIER